MNPPKKINPTKIHEDYCSRMTREVEDMGVPTFDADNGFLAIDSEFLCLPANITESTSKELGEYLNAFTQQKVYMRTLQGQVDLIVEDAQRNYYEASASMYRGFTDNKMSETAKERLINTSPKVKPVYEVMQDAKHKRSIITRSIENIEDIIFMVSREISRRTGDFEEDRRNHTVSRR